MRFADEDYQPVSHEDWERGGGPATLDEAARTLRDEFARQHGRQPANIGEFRLWWDGLTPEEVADTLTRVYGGRRAPCPT
jgi:hypothetical protein